MKIQIENNLYLESDSMQFMLKEYTGNTDKLGNELYNTKGYFTNVQNAVKHLLKMKLMDSTATTLNGLLSDVRRIESFIESKITV